jgi:hypothetical protein
MAEHLTHDWDKAQLDVILGTLAAMRYGSGPKLDMILNKLNYLTHSIDKQGELLMGNKEALQALTDEITNEVVPILQDLAAKAGTGVDVSQGLTDLAASLKSSAEAADPGFVPPAPPAPAP